MSPLPRISFDTSVLNAMEEADFNSEPLMCALREGFRVTVLPPNIDEIIATPDATKREALVLRCVRLLASGECIWPHHWIVQLLIREYRKAPVHFDWRRVDMRAKTFEQALIRRNYTDQVCIDQRVHQFAVERNHAKAWNQLRPKLAPILANLKPSQRPTCFQQAVEIAERAGGVLWSIAGELYRHETGIDPSEDEIRHFVEACPPFRAVCYAEVGTWYDRALRPSHRKQPLIGRNDTMMATYLPYCDSFIARDWPQTNRFREVVAAAHIDCEILSYAEFCNRFSVIVQKGSDQ